jgi:hypothetical protein
MRSGSKPEDVLASMTLAAGDMEFLQGLGGGGSHAAPTKSAQLPPRESTMASYQEWALAETHKWEGIMQRGHRTMKQTQMPMILNGPAPALASLTPISVRGIAEQINCIRTGRVLFATLVGPPAFRIVGTNVLLEDEHGDVMQLSLYNSVPEQVLARIMLSAAALGATTREAHLLRRWIQRRSFPSAAALQSSSLT